MLLRYVVMKPSHSSLISSIGSKTISSPGNRWKHTEHVHNCQNSEQLNKYNTVYLLTFFRTCRVPSASGNPKLEHDAAELPSSSFPAASWRMQPCSPWRVSQERQRTSSAPTLSSARQIWPHSPASSEGPSSEGPCWLQTTRPSWPWQQRLQRQLAWQPVQPRTWPSDAPPNCGMRATRRM